MLKDLFHKAEGIFIEGDPDEIIAVSRISRYNPKIGCMERKVTTRREYERMRQNDFWIENIKKGEFCLIKYG